MNNVLTRARRTDSGDDGELSRTPAMGSGFPERETLAAKLEGRLEGDLWVKRKEVERELEASVEAESERNE